MPFAPRKLVVVPIDFSGKSTDAVTTALDFVESPEDVHAVHVVSPLGNMAPGVDWGVVDDQARRDSVVKHFDEFLTERGIKGVRSVVLLGDPGTEIAEYAESQHADLIVISSHGYDGMKRMVLGSVTERVIRYASCAVLVLRRTDAE